MIYIGIDPGESGAIAFILEDGSSIAVPFNAEAYKKLLRDLKGERCFCVVEQVYSRSAQGVKSVFNFGENYGYIQGLLKAYDIPHQLVSPQAWKKSFGVTADKNSSIAVCKRLFPEVSLKRTERCRKEHDGMAEALLMAEYGRRMYANE